MTMTMRMLTTKTTKTRIRKKTTLILKMTEKISCPGRRLWKLTTQKFLQKKILPTKILPTTMSTTKILKTAAV